jgi:hypothetical protein
MVRFTMLKSLDNYNITDLHNLNIIFIINYFIQFQVSLSAFSFLFSEFVQYAHRKVTHIKDLQRR